MYVMCDVAWFFSMLSFFIICLEGPRGGPRSAGGALIFGAMTMSSICVFIIHVSLSPFPFFFFFLFFIQFWQLSDVPFHQLVSAAYLSNAQSIFLVVNNFMMFMSLPPVLFCRFCHTA